MRNLLTLALLLACAPRIAAQQPPSSVPVRAVDEAALRGAFESYLDRMAEYGFSGAVLVAHDGKVLLNRGYGLADRERGIPNTAETVFTTGSLSKQFTAAAILRLEEEGKLRTTDSLTRFFDSVPEDKRGITLHQLLTHTSGVVPLVTFNRDQLETDRDAFVRRTLATPLRNPPGAAYLYSNAGYSLLAAVVEKVSGRPFAEFLRDELFALAGLRRTGYLPDTAGVPVARLYGGGRDNGSVLGDGVPPWGIRGAGGIATTTADMLRWYQALQGGKVLSEAERGKLFTPYVGMGPMGGARYAYGWAVFEGPAGRMIAHNGGTTGGIGAELRHYPESGVVVVSFANVDGEEILIRGMHPAFGRLVRGEKVELPPATGPADPSARAKLAGRYLLPGGGELRVDTAGGALRLAAYGQPAFDLVMGGVAGPGVEAMNARAVEVAGAAFRGDYAPLARFTGERRPEVVGDRFFGRWVRELGPFREARVLGTLPGEEPATFVQADFERGSVVLRLDFAGDEFLGAMRVPSGAGRELRPLREGGFAGYDWGSGKVVRVRPAPDGAGVVVESGGRTVTARRA